MGDGAPRTPEGAEMLARVDTYLWRRQLEAPLSWLGDIPGSSDRIPERDVGGIVLLVDSSRGIDRAEQRLDGEGSISVHQFPCRSARAGEVGLSSGAE